MIPQGELVEGMNDFLFHTTKHRFVKPIAGSGKLLPGKRAEYRYVSLSSIPTTDPGTDFGDVVLVFDRKKLARRVDQVVYTRAWMKKHRKQALYIADEVGLTLPTKPSEEDWSELADAFTGMYREKEWITKNEGKPLTFKRGELVAVLCRDCATDEEADMHLKHFAPLVSLERITTFTAGMRRIKAGNWPPPKGKTLRSKRKTKPTPKSTPTPTSQSAMMRQLIQKHGVQGARRLLGLESITPDHRLADGAPIKTGGWLKLKKVKIPLSELQVGRTYELNEARKPATLKMGDVKRAIAKGGRSWQAQSLELLLLPPFKRRLKKRYKINIKRVKGGYVVHTWDVPWNVNNPDPSMAFNAIQRKTRTELLHVLSALRGMVTAKTRSEFDEYFDPSAFNAVGVWIDNAEYLAMPESVTLEEATLKLDLDDNDGVMKKMLDHISKTASGGHSFSVVVDPGDRDYEQSYGIDGDGQFRMKVSEERAERSGAVKVGMDAWRKAHPEAVKKAKPKGKLIREAQAQDTIPAELVLEPTDAKKIKGRRASIGPYDFRDDMPDDVFLAYNEAAITKAKARTPNSLIVVGVLGSQKVRALVDRTTRAFFTKRVMNEDVRVDLGDVLEFDSYGDDGGFSLTDNEGTDHFFMPRDGGMFYDGYGRDVTESSESDERAVEQALNKFTMKNLHSYATYMSIGIGGMSMGLIQRYSEMHRMRKSALIQLFMDVYRANEHLARQLRISLRGRGLMEAREDEGPDHRESVVITIPLPKRVSEEWPSLGDEDDSPTHITMLYVGEVCRKGYTRILKAVHDVCASVKPFTIEMTDYGEFQNPGGQTIAHMIPRALHGTELAEIHERLWQQITGRGVEVQHIRDGAFKPHATLAYVESGESYDGPKPAATWGCSYLDVWGASEDSPFGYKRVSLHPVTDCPHNSLNASGKPRGTLVREAAVQAPQVSQVSQRPVAAPRIPPRNGTSPQVILTPLTQLAQQVPAHG